MSLESRALVSRLLKQSILELCQANIPLDQDVEIDGIVCITLGSDDDQIVVKVHEILGSPKAKRLGTLSEISFGASQKKSIKSNHQIKKVSKEGLILIEPSWNAGDSNISENQRESIRDRQKQSADKVKNQTSLCAGKSNIVRQQLCLGKDQSVSTGQIQQASLVIEDVVASPDANGAHVNGHRTISNVSHDVTKSSNNFDQNNLDVDTPNDEGSKMISGAKMNLKTASVPVVIKIEKTSDDEGECNGHDANTNVEHSSDSCGPSAVKVASKHYECEHCPVVASSQHVLKEHNELIHGAQTCNFCGRFFQLKSNYDLHIKTHVGERARRSKYFTKEELEGTSEKPIRCGMCGKAFKQDDVALLLSHLKSCHEFEEFLACIPCGEYFSYQNALAVHKTSKHLKDIENLQHESHDCGLAFTEKEVSNHNRESHSGAAAPDSDEEGVHRKRSKLSSKGDMLVQVMDSQHLSLQQQRDLFLVGTPPVSSIMGVPPLVSSTDGTVISNQEEQKTQTLNLNGQEGLKAVIQHGKSKVGKSPQIMEVDTGSTSLQSSLHIQSVFSSKVPGVMRKRIEEGALPLPCKGPYRCRLCDELFDIFEQFEKHCLEVHWRCVCPYCAQTFATKRNVRRHMRKHTGEQPYTCWDCGQKFYRDDDLRRHQVTAHNQLQVRFYCCAYCGLSIDDLTYFTRHLMASHNMKDEQITNEEMGKHYVL